MASLRDSIQTNRKIMIVIAVLLAILIGFVTKFYVVQGRENHALRIKLLSMSANKRTPKTWAALTTKTPPVTTINLSPTMAQTDSASQQGIQENSQEDIQDLAIKLDAQMKDTKNLNAATIDENISLANEILSREPDSYGAYKAKLISLLVKEGKFNQEVADEEIESILESMAEFNVDNDTLSRKEAVLIGNSNREISNFENQIQNIELAQQQIEQERMNLDPNSEEYKVLTGNLNGLEAQMSGLYEQLEIAQGSLEQSLALNTVVGNEDIVEIPLMRLMAKNDLDAVIDNAESLIKEFPDSPNAYFYLVRALEMQGEREQSLSVLENSQLSKESQSVILQRLENEKGVDPKRYWEKLIF